MSLVRSLIITTADFLFKVGQFGKFELGTESNPMDKEGFQMMPTVMPRKSAKKELGPSIRMKPNLRKLQFILRLFRIGIPKTNRPTRRTYQVIIREHLDLDFLVVLVDHKSEFTDVKWIGLGRY